MLKACCCGMTLEESRILCGRKMVVLRDLSLGPCRLCCALLAALYAEVDLGERLTKCKETYRS